MPNRRLLALASAIEAATGLALMIDPTGVVRLLLGADLAPAGTAVARVGGFGLLSLGLACWPGAAAVGNAAVVRGMLTYNLLASIYLFWLAAGGEFESSLLWLAATVHATITVLLVRASWLQPRVDGVAWRGPSTDRVDERAAPGRQNG